MVPSVTRITCYQCQCHLEGCTRKIQRSGNRSLQRKVSQTLGIRMEMIKRIMESRTVIASAVLYDQSGRCHSIDIQRRAQRSQDRGKESNNDTDGRNHNFEENAQAPGMAWSKEARGTEC
jgi:hypothetical protein